MLLAGVSHDYLLSIFFPNLVGEEDSRIQGAEGASVGNLKTLLVPSTFHSNP